jgi:hypothetical protein
VYKLPKDFDGSFFLGRTLECVLFNENTVDFLFDEHVGIGVESSLQHQIALEDEQSEVQAVPLSQSRLMQLLGRCVTGVKAGDDGTLVLSFDNGHVLRIFDDQPHYESYSIRHGDKEIFV